MVKERAVTRGGVVSEGHTHGDAVVRHPASAPLADRGRVLQGGAGAIEHVQKDLPAMAAEHVTDDL